MSIRQEKRVISSSFSKPHQSLATEKTNSFSADKVGQLRAEQKIAEKNIVSKVIQALNTQKANPDVIWKLNSFEEKRTITGFKGRIQWYSTSKDMRVILKISLSNGFFRLINHLTEGDIIVQIEQLNFHLNNDEKIELQEKIEKIVISIIEITKRKTFVDEIKKQTECLRCFLQDFNNQLQKKQYEGKRKINQKIDKNLSKMIMLYPAPAAFAWNPLGSICITQNKYPIHKKTFQGGPNILKRYFENNRQDLNLNLYEEDNSLEVVNESTNYQSIYEWKIDEEIELIIFNKEKQYKRQDKFYANKLKNQLDQNSKKQQQKKDEQGILLAYLNRISSNKLRRIYERYFGRGQRISQFHRHDKLRVYDVRSFNKNYEDDIVFIMQKVNGEDQNELLQNLFCNELSSHPKILQTMNSIKYKLLSGVLIKNLLSPQTSFLTYLKIFILQNEFLGSQIEQYFKKMYRRLKIMPHSLLFSIGSYIHFNDIKAQTIFIDILERLLDLTENPQDLLKVSTSDGGERVNLKISSIVKFPKFSYESVISQIDKTTFLMNLFPILIVKDREMERFQFKQVKRVITANTKLFLFIRKINDIISKEEEGRILFLKSLIASFKRYKQSEETGDESSVFRARKIFSVFCKGCLNVNRSFGVLSKQQAEYCPKCGHKLLQNQ